MLKDRMVCHGTKMQSWASFTEGRKDIFAEPILNKIGGRHGKSSAQAALRFLVQNGIAVIPKSVPRERMEQNLSSFNLELTAADIRQIDSLDGGQSLFNWY